LKIHFKNSVSVGKKIKKFLIYIVSSYKFYFFKTLIFEKITINNNLKDFKYLKRKILGLNKILISQPR